MGGTATDVSSVGGALDLIIGHHGIDGRVEIKASYRSKYTAAEINEMDRWKGARPIIWITQDDVIDTYNEFLRRSEKLRR